MGLRKWYEVVRMDFPRKRETTDESVEMTRFYSGRFRSSVRVAMGRVWTSAGL